MWTSFDDKYQNDSQPRLTDGKVWEQYYAKLFQENNVYTLRQFVLCKFRSGSWELGLSCTLVARNASQACNTYLHGSHKDALPHIYVGIIIASFGSKIS